MAISKGLYAAPQGLEELIPEGAPDIEIEIEDPESVNIGMGDIEIDLKPQKETADTFDANLAEYMDDKDLAMLSSELIDDFDKDTQDRKDWIKTYVDGLKLLGLKYEERTEPWQGACGVFHPMLTESVVRFQSEGITETFPAMGPVKTKIIGKDTPEAEDAAARVQEDMNYQLTEVMVEYRPEHEKMLWNLPLAGSAFKKVYYDPSRGRQAAVFIPAEDIVVPYGATSLETAERVTHVMRKTENEILRLQNAGFYANVELGEPGYELDDIEKQKAEENGMSATQDDRYRILEMHVDLDLPGFEHTDKKGKPTGIAPPALRPLPIHPRFWILWLWSYPPYRRIRKERDDAHPPARGCGNTFKPTRGPQVSRSSHQRRRHAHPTRRVQRRRRPKWFNQGQHSPSAIQRAKSGSVWPVPKHRRRRQSVCLIRRYECVRHVGTSSSGYNIGSA